MNLDIVADFADKCGESPVWDRESGKLFWTDCGGLRFYSYDPADGSARELRSGFEVNGFRLNRGGGFVVSNNSGVWIWNSPEAEPRLVVSEVEGRPCRLNDCVADPHGRLLTGSWFYDPASDYPLGQLVRVDNDGNATVVDDGFHLSNGLAFSPDGSTLYYADSAIRTIYAYDYDVAAGIASRRRIFVRVPDDEGLPDGLRVDSQGHVWAAQWYGSCVVRYDPEGRVERRILVPAKQVSCMTFGGPDLTTLYITTAGFSESMPVMPPGYDPTVGPFGGALYRIDTGIAGLADLRAAISF